MKAQMHCPLCGDAAPRDYYRDRRRDYLQCDTCELVFVPLQYHLDASAEKAEYDLHENAVDDPGYRRFLARLADPLLQRLAVSSNGLDFGCGPGPALAAILSEAGHSMSLYDLYYYPDQSVFTEQYDFICATEVVEHLAVPGDELARLWQCLRPGGVLGVMTKLVRDVDAFAGWHYKNDPTHIAFFSVATWQWWAARCDASLEFQGDDVILLEKQR